MGSQPKTKAEIMRKIADKRARIHDFKPTSHIRMSANMLNIKCRVKLRI